MCNESSLLFNLYIADLNLELKKRNIGDVELEGDKIWNLVYADYVVLKIGEK